MFSATLAPNLNTLKFMETILIVDDEPDIVELLSYHFKHRGYHILKAHNGQEGLEMALKHMPEAIICDIRMPLMTGIEMCQQLKGNSLFLRVPFIFLSASNDDMEVLNAIQAGGDDYLSKPVHIPILMKNVRSFLDRNQPLFEQTVN